MVNKICVSLENYKNVLVCTETDYFTRNTHIQVLECPRIVIDIFLVHPCTQFNPAGSKEIEILSIEEIFCEKRNASTLLVIEPRTFRLPVECSII